MSLPWILAALHLIGLAIGLGAVWARGRAFSGPLDGDGVRRVLAADNWWGLSALLLLSTGLYRLLAGTEKVTDYYLANHLFYGKMALLLLILVLEVPPMVALIRWRRQLAKGDPVDTRAARRFGTTSRIQAVALVLMILAATGMARGAGN